MVLAARNGTSEAIFINKILPQRQEITPWKQESSWQLTALAVTSVSAQPAPTHRQLLQHRVQANTFLVGSLPT